MSERPLELRVGKKYMEQISINVEVWNQGEIDSIHLHYSCGR